MAFKLPRRKYFPAFFLIAVLAALALWFQLKNPRPEVLLFLLGAAGGFAYFLYRQHLDETKLFLELFTVFNARYDKLSNDLNKILDGPKNGLMSQNERDTVFKYFNLCAEEFLFHESGYIDDKVWKTWLKGMAIFFSHPRIAAVWETEKETDSYYGFYPPTENL